MSETRTRLTTDQRLEVLALISRGDTFVQVMAYLKREYDVDISSSALSQLKKTHREVIIKMQEKMLDAQAVDAEAIMKRSRIQINRRLDKADRDQSAIEELDEQYRDGDMSLEAYRRKKRGLIQLSISELTQIGKAMHEQTRDAPLPPANPALPSGAVPESTGLPSPYLESVLKHIAAGNTVELQRMILTPPAR